MYEFLIISESVAARKGMAYMECDRNADGLTRKQTQAVMDMYNHSENIGTTPVHAFKGAFPETFKEAKGYADRWERTGEVRAPEEGEWFEGTATNSGYETKGEPCLARKDYHPNGRKWILLKVTGVTP